MFDCLHNSDIEAAVVTRFRSATSTSSCVWLSLLLLLSVELHAAASAQWGFRMSSTWLNFHIFTLRREIEEREREGVDIASDK